MSISVQPLRSFSGLHFAAPRPPPPLFFPFRPSATMAKRELSTTLKNLKFMQRAIQREDKSKVEQEIKVEVTSVSQTTQRKKCLVIMEGDPPPGAVKGRMSFLGFNPKIDKQNDEAHPSTRSANNQNDGTSGRSGNGTLEDKSHSLVNAGREDDFDEDHKRKHTMVENDSQARHGSGTYDSGQSSKKSKTNRKNKKHQSVDWKVLMPPKPNPR